MRMALPLRQTRNVLNMEIVSIEKKTFEMMLASFNALSEKVAALKRKNDGGRLERWLTGEEVCGQLRISPRTLQTLRDKRLLADKPQVLLQAGRSQEADSAYRYALSRRQIILLFTH